MECENRLIVRIAHPHHATTATMDRLLSRTAIVVKCFQAKKLTPFFIKYRKFLSIKIWVLIFSLQKTYHCAIPCILTIKRQNPSKSLISTQALENIHYISPVSHRSSRWIDSRQIWRVGSNCRRNQLCELWAVDWRVWILWGQNSLIPGDDVEPLTQYCAIPLYLWCMQSA